MTNMKIAEIILSQLGGSGRLKAMINGRNFVAIENGIRFQFSGCKKYSYIQIELNSMDLYNISLFKAYKNEKKNLVEVKDFYADMMKEYIERETGLYLSL